MNQIKLLWGFRQRIHFLAVSKIKIKYIETVFGLGWSVVKPLMYVGTFWFFFSVGLRSGEPVNGDMFILSLFAGFMCWSLIIEVLNDASSFIKKNKLLVTTIRFPVTALPVIEVLAKIYVHIGVMAIVSLLFPIIGGWSYLPDVYYLNFIYYWFVLGAYLLGIGLLLSTVSIIIPDVKNLVLAISQPLFWLTPVLWKPQGIIELISKLFNPHYFFIKGYRETMLEKVFFWEEIWYDIYVWIIIIILYIVAIGIWNKVRPLMADYI